MSNNLKTTFIGAPPYHTPKKAMHLRTIPEDLHRRVKAEAALRGLTIEEFVRQALENNIAPPLEIE